MFTCTPLISLFGMNDYEYYVCVRLCKHVEGSCVH